MSYPQDMLMKQQAEQGYLAGSANTPMRPRTLRENLLAQKAEFTQRLANVDAALSALDDNPNFEKVLDVVQKVY